MNRLKMFWPRLPSFNLPALAFLALATKAVVLNISLADAMAFLCACGVYGYQCYLKSKQPDPVRINAEVKQELDNLKGALSAIKLEKNMSAQAKRFF